MTLKCNSLPLRFFWPFLGKEGKKQTIGMMSTNALADKNIRSQNTVDVAVCKHRTREDVPNTTWIIGETVVGNQCASRIVKIPVPVFVNSTLKYLNLP